MSRFSTPLDLPLALFIFSALVGVVISYDPVSSSLKFALIAISVLFFYLVIALQRARAEVSESVAPFLVTMVWGFLFANAALAVYFITQHDFSNQIKLALITQIGAQLHAWSPQLHWHDPHPNIVAGVLELALPINLMFAWRLREDAARAKFALAIVLELVIGLGLVMTSSRGAWVALGAVAVAAVGMAMARPFFSWARSPRRVFVPVGAGVVLIGALGVFRFPDLASLPGALYGISSILSRIDLYAKAWALIQDYYFTGSGLGVFPMVFSTYALLLNVPFLTHVHNLFLQIWIEQGVLGLIAFGWVVVEFYFFVLKRRGHLNWLAIGGLAATSVMLLHNLLDVTLYSSRALPLLFLPMGLTLVALDAKEPQVDSVSSRPKFALGLAALALGTLVLTGALARDPLMALWHANVGSVIQTRVELAQYKFPDGLVEYVRRDANLSQAEENFRDALRFDPNNLTARQRLGTIALSRGDYDHAREYLESAYARDPVNEVTLELLGDTYLATGDLDDAYALWSRVGEAESQLRIEAVVRYQRDQERAGWTLALADEIRAARGEAK